MQEMIVPLSRAGKRNFGSLLVLLVMMLLLPQVPLLAEDICDDESKVEGFISSLDIEAGLLVVGQTALSVDGRTELKDKDGNAVPLSFFKDGDFVKAEYCPNVGNPPVAEKIELEDISSPSPTITPTPTTTSPSPSPTGTPRPTVTVTPRPTDDDDDCDEDIESIVSAIDLAAGTLVVGGILVRTDARTEFEDIFSNDITLSVIRVGNRVEAEGCFLSDGSLQALKVELKSDSRVTPTPTPTGTSGPTFGNNDCGQKVEGLVAEINIEERTVLIGSVLVFTDSRTRFERDTDEDDILIRFEDLLVGDYVEAEGCFRTDGTLLAREVDVDDDLDDDTPGPDSSNNDCDHEVENVIDSINAADGTITVRGIIVRTNERTRFEDDRDDNGIDDDDDVPILFSDLAAGDYVEAEGCFQPDGSLLAKKVERKRLAGSNPQPNDDREIEIYGVVQEVDLINSLVVVSGVRFLVDERSEIEYDDDDDRRLTLSALRVGMRVEIEGVLVSAGQFRATEIDIKEENEWIDEDDDDSDRRQQVRGLVTSIDLPTSMTVNARAIDLSSSPTVTNFNGLPASLDAISVGDRVRVEGVSKADGTVLARRIAIRASVISAIDESGLAIFLGSTRVAITGTTVLRDRAGNTITLADLSVGDLLRVQGVPTAEGLNATRITLLAGVEFSGTVGSFDDVTGNVDDGVPTLTSTSSDNSFGFAQLPTESFDGGAGFIYEVEARVSTTVTDRTQVPELRLRSSLSGFERSSFLVATSLEDARFSPTPEGKLYRAYFVPALRGGESDWYSAMDLLNFLGTDDPTGQLRLESIAARPIPLEGLRVVDTLFETSFSTGAEGWVFGDAAGSFTPAPAVHNAAAGAIEVSAADSNTFGFWSVDTGVAPASDVLYRGRFLVSFPAGTPAAAPTVRARLNLSNFQMASGTVIESVGSASESPAATSRIYDVYLSIPGQAANGVTLRASFDLLNFLDGKALQQPILLEHFTLERMEIRR